MLLLQYKADVNEADRMHRTLLHCACKRGDLKMVELLLQCSADASAPGLYHSIRQTFYDATPLEVACAKGHFDIVSMLLKHLTGKVADPDTAGRALFFAC